MFWTIWGVCQVILQHFHLFVWHSEINLPECTGWPEAEVRAPAELGYTVRSHGCGSSVPDAGHYISKLNPVANGAWSAHRQQESLAKSGEQLNQSIDVGRRVWSDADVCWPRVWIMQLWGHEQYLLMLLVVHPLSYHSNIFKKFDFTPSAKCEKPQCFQFSNKTQVAAFGVSPPY